MITVSTLLELPETVYQTMRMYVLTHPGVDRDKFVAEAINEALLRRSQAELMQLQAIAQEAVES
jgi:hypothetical protein